MRPIATDDASEAALPHAGEDLLINKTTGQRRAAAPTGSLLLTSVPFGWRGIIVEQHRLPPMELAEHSVIGHGISVNVGAQPGAFAWTRGRGGWSTGRPVLGTVKSVACCTGRFRNWLIRERPDVAA